MKIYCFTNSLIFSSGVFHEWTALGKETLFCYCTQYILTLKWYKEKSYRLKFIFFNFKGSQGWNEFYWQFPPTLETQKNGHPTCFCMYTAQEVLCQARQRFQKQLTSHLEVSTLRIQLCNLSALSPSCLVPPTLVSFPYWRFQDSLQARINAVNARTWPSTFILDSASGNFLPLIPVECWGTTCHVLAHNRPSTKSSPLETELPYILYLFLNTAYKSNLNYSQPSHQRRKIFYSKGKNENESS